MKITKKYLQKVIKEETRLCLQELGPMDLEAQFYEDWKSGALADRENPDQFKVYWRKGWIDEKDMGLSAAGLEIIAKFRNLGKHLQEIIEEELTNILLESKGKDAINIALSHPEFLKKLRKDTGIKDAADIINTASTGGKLDLLVDLLSNGLECPAGDVIDRHGKPRCDIKKMKIHPDWDKHYLSSKLKEIKNFDKEVAGRVRGADASLLMQTYEQQEKKNTNKTLLEIDANEAAAAQRERVAAALRKIAGGPREMCAGQPPMDGPGSSIVIKFEEGDVVLGVSDSIGQWDADAETPDHIFSRIKNSLPEDLRANLEYRTRDVYHGEYVLTHAELRGVIQGDPCRLSDALMTAADAAQGEDFVATQPPIKEATNQKPNLILEQHRKSREVHPVTKKQWWYDA